MWQYHGQQRPDFADAPGPEQESVWDYPRPPVIVPCTRRVEVKKGATVIADSVSGVRVLETASPPTIYVPPDDVDLSALIEVPGSSFCEWKGTARYWALKTDPGAAPIGWSYPDPRPDFSRIRDWLCFYPGRVSCFLDGERVRPQEGGFYGGWVTDDIVGPWKGGPNTGGW
jgi:uncharacterized protein (DUF427 family)